MRKIALRRHERECLCNYKIICFVHLDQCGLALRCIISSVDADALNSIHFMKSAKEMFSKRSQIGLLIENVQQG